MNHACQQTLAMAGGLTVRVARPPRLLARTAGQRFTIAYLGTRVPCFLVSVSALRNSAVIGVCDRTVVWAFLRGKGLATG